MNDIKGLLSALTSPVTVSGYEGIAEDTVSELCRLYFDEVKNDGANNYQLIKKAKTKGAKKILIDAHMDEVGMLVSDILDGGFLRVTNVGGIDCKILQPCEVTIHAKEDIYGIVSATPPHLMSKNELPDFDGFFIDTGFKKEELEEKGVRVGTPISFKYHMTELLNNRICGKGFDDKICICAGVEAVKLLGDTDCEIILQLSSREEIGKSAAVGAYNTNPDLCVVLDVTGAEIPEEKDTIYKSSVMCGGAEISISAITDVKLTKKLIKFAKDNSFPHQINVDGTNTGTNANDIPTIKCGIPTVLLSIPLLNMHTYAEIISLDDVKSTAELTAGFIKAFIKEGEI